MNDEQCKEAVAWRLSVQAMFTHADGSRGPHVVGRVVAYCDAPQLLIETEDGEHVWWRADLTELVREPVQT